MRADSIGISSVRGAGIAVERVTKGRGEVEVIPNSQVRRAQISHSRRCSSWPAIQPLTSILPFLPHTYQNAGSNESAPRKWDVK